MDPVRGVEAALAATGASRWLAKHDLIKEVWTTNFDSLGAQAAIGAGVAVLEAPLSRAKTGSTE